MNLELDGTEEAALAALLRAEIENTRWPMAPRTRALRAILEKLEPPAPRPQPFPRPKPIGEPSIGAGAEEAPAALAGY
jgi:hypothetical protein